MNEDTLAIARNLLEQIGSGTDPDLIAQGISEDVSLEIPGDETALPWIGSQVGRRAVAQFLRDQREQLIRNWFRVDDILCNADRAVILGELSATIKRTGKTIPTHFAIVLTVAGGVVTRFQMLENSHAASRAAHQCDVSVSKKRIEGPVGPTALDLEYVIHS